MSLRPQQPIPPVPDDTARIARAAFRRGNPYLLLRDRLGAVFADTDFADLYPEFGQPGYAPWRLALAPGRFVPRRLVVRPDRHGVGDAEQADTDRQVDDATEAWEVDLGPLGALSVLLAVLPFDAAFLIALILAFLDPGGDAARKHAVGPAGGDADRLFQRGLELAGVAAVEAVDHDIFEQIRLTDIGRKLAAHLRAFRPSCTAGYAQPCDCQGNPLSGHDDLPRIAASYHRGPVVVSPPLCAIWSRGAAPASAAAYAASASAHRSRAG